MPQISYIDIRDDLDPNNIEMGLTVTNNNNGSIYNSADLNVAKQLATDLWALDVNSNSSNPLWNGYDSMAEMVADWPGVSISGEVANGWNSTTNPDGSFSLFNQSTTGGEIDTDYDGWYSTSVFPSQDMQFYTINIPKKQLELDGIAGYNPATDATIVLSGEGNTMNDAFVGYTGVGGFQAEGQYFQVQVPEVSSSALVMGGLAAIVAGKKLLSRKRQ